MSQSSEVVASLRWDCGTCERNGWLHLGVVPDVLGVWGRIKRMHEEASPTCVGAPNYVQIDVPEGAEINDPRARDNVFVLKPSSGTASRMLIAASTAMLASTYAGDGMPCPFSDTSATARNEERRAKSARHDRLVAKAEAKRARKRSPSSPRTLTDGPLNDQEAT